MPQACALIIANQSCLVRVAGASSLEWVVRALRAETRVRELYVVTSHQAVQSEAERLGVATLSDNASSEVPVTQSSGFEELLDEVARFPTQSSVALERVNLDGAGRRLVFSRVSAIVERGRYAALLVVNADKPLIQSEDVGRLLDAVRDVHSAALVFGPERGWFQADASGAWLRSPQSHLVEMEVAHAVRVASGDERRAAPIAAALEVGWSVAESNQRLGIDAVLRSRKQLERYTNLPSEVGALVMDFDGVFTDNGVLVSQKGEESVRCDRGDGLGLSMLRATGLPMVVISKETNPVVQARCAKLQIHAMLGVDDKLPSLIQWAARHQVPQSCLVYIGNDVNDLECLQWAGCGVVVADAHPKVLEVADVILEQLGGRGALRELCDQIIGRVHGAFPVVPTGARV